MDSREGKEKCPATIAGHEHITLGLKPKSITTQPPALPPPQPHCAHRIALILNQTYAQICILSPTYSPVISTKLCHKHVIIHKNTGSLHDWIYLHGIIVDIPYKF